MHSPIGEQPNHPLLMLASLQDDRHSTCGVEDVKGRASLFESVSRLLQVLLRTKDLQHKVGFEGIGVDTESSASGRHGLQDAG